MPATEELRVLIKTIADTSGVKQTEASLKGVQSQAATAGKTSGLGMAAFAGAAGIAAAAGTAFVGVMGEAIATTRDHERILRATTASYGAQTAAWTKFADQLSATTGF